MLDLNRMYRAILTLDAIASDVAEWEGNREYLQKFRDLVDEINEVHSDLFEKIEHETEVEK